MDDLPHTLQDYRKRLDQYKRFLDPTLADDQDDYYGPIRPIIGPELSVANLDKEDLFSYVLQVRGSQEFLINGLDSLALSTMTTMTAELKLSMSIDGRVMDNVFSNRMEYTQTQTIHEHQHPMERKRGLFGGGPPREGGS